MITMTAAKISSIDHIGEMLGVDHEVAIPAIPRAIALRASKIPMPVRSFVVIVKPQVVTNRPELEYLE